MGDNLAESVGDLQDLLRETHEREQHHLERIAALEAAVAAQADALASLRASLTDSGTIPGLAGDEDTKSEEAAPPQSFNALMEHVQSLCYHDRISYAARFGRDNRDNPDLVALLQEALCIPTRTVNVEVRKKVPIEEERFSRRYCR